MKIGVKLFTIAIALFGLTPVWADTFTYEALKDFTDIDAGAVPYYRHNGVNALAINAAIEEYRDEFARATLVFPESAGTYDVTITALGEIDGDGEFRFLIDGVVVGSAINTPTTIDFSEQRHTFEKINIPAGALLGVESVAVSNDTIPEGDAYAYARGRWTTLTIEEVGTATDKPLPTVTPVPVVVPEPIVIAEPVVVPEPVLVPEPVVVPDPAEPVDLSITVETPAKSVTLGAQVTYTIEVQNLSTTVATTTVAVVNLPHGLTNAVSDTCAESSTGVLSCELSEIAPGKSTTFSFTALAATVGEKEVAVEVSGDQEDKVAGNNSNIVATLVEAEVSLPVDNTVDLQLEYSSDKEQIEVGDSVTYTLTVTNLHSTNTATSPVTGVTLPNSLQFEASDACTVNGSTIRCNLEELPPAASTTVQFTATAATVNTFSQLIASVSSDQAENQIDNNEVIFVTDIRAKALNSSPVTVQPDETNSTTEVKTKSSGGGALHITALLLLLSLRLMLLLNAVARPRHLTSK